MIGRGVSVSFSPHCFFQAITRPLQCKIPAILNLPFSNITSWFSKQFIELLAILPHSLKASALSIILGNLMSTYMTFLTLLPQFFDLCFQLHVLLLYLSNPLPSKIPTGTHHSHTPSTMNSLTSASFFSCLSLRSPQPHGHLHFLSAAPPAFLSLLIQRGWQASFQPLTFLPFPPSFQP